MNTAAPRRQFASDNYSGICPEAWASLEEANHGHVRSYGDDAWTARAAELRAGDAAPEFSLVGSDGATHKLSDYRGKQAVVLAWFPKAFTGG